MKKRIALLMVLVMLALSLAGCGGSQSSTGEAAGKTDNSTTIEPVTIRLAYNLPASHYIPQEIENFAKIVGERSEGKVTIKTFPAGQLFSDKEMNEAILMGNVEMGLNSNSMWATIVPAMGIFDVPFLFPNYDVAAKAFKGEVGKALSDALEEKGAKVLFWGDYGYTQFANNVKPIKAPEDFKGLKIRAHGEIISETIGAFGGAPVFMGAGEVYMALQRGTIDGASSGTTAMVSRKFYEVSKYLTVNNASFTEFPLVVNLKFWNSLPEPTRKLIQDAASESEDKIRTEAEKQDKDALKELEAKGMIVYNVPAEELPQWKKAAEPVWELFKKNSGSLGTKALEAVIDIK